jgi:hypothetical protein
MPKKYFKQVRKRFVNVYKDFFRKVKFNDQASRFALAVFLILILLAISSLARQKMAPSNQPAPTPKIEKAQEPSAANPGQRTTGIVTFFLTGPMTGQMEVFSDWEGKYRTVSGGNTFAFLFLDKKAQNPEIFSIEYMNARDWDKNKKSAKFLNSQEIKREAHLVFIMHRGSSDSLTDQKEVAGLQAMKRDVDSMVKTFRVFPAR